MAAEFSHYYDAKHVGDAVAGGHHREMVGGMWQELGQFQLDLLTAHGLQSHHKMLDIGCGCLRGGVHFAGYLDQAHYFGTDLNDALIQIGYERELPEAGLQDRIPRANLIAQANFDFAVFGILFDRALAFSLFTHLPLNSIRVCLERLAPVMVPGGILHATFFELTNARPSFADVRHEPAGIVTHGDADPYHYRVADLEHAVARLPWEMRYIGGIGHPRGQRLINLVRLPDKRDP